MKATTPPISPMPTADLTDILRTLAMCLTPGQVTELRALDVSTPRYRRPHTVSGYFDDWDRLADEAAKLARYAKGVYIIPNVVDPALLARAVNRVRAVDREPLTSDTNIIRRRWLPLDADPARAAGISSTDAEHAAGLARIDEIQAALRAESWPEGAKADSGNGGHGLYAIDLPNDAASRTLLEQVLQALAFRFDDGLVTLDTTVYNSARIWKLYGTVARKGDHTAERPHRVSRLLEVPERWEVVTLAQLQALARQRPAPPQAPRTSPRQGTGEGFDLDQWIARHGLDLIGPTPWQGGRKWVFRVCPWQDEHRNRSAVIVQQADGAIGARCLHNSCTGKSWHALRDLLEPGWRASKPPYQAKKPRRGSPERNGTAAPAAPVPEDDADAWQAQLSTTKDGVPWETLGNVTMALQHLEPWASACWYDVVRDLRMVGAHELDDIQVTTAALAIEAQTGMLVRSKHLAAIALTYLCHQRPRDLLQEWLDALPPWDGTARLKTWLATYAHADAGAYAADVSRLLPVSMVARALDPGCQYRFVVILEGPEDSGKTKLVRALATPAWYRELTQGLDGKEAHMRLKRAWVAELAELASLTKTEEARLKAFFTLNEDAYVPKFSNFEVVHQRRTVFIGTVNPEGDNTYLRGQTGNTRYLPIRVRDIHLEGFEAVRDQLFAEALAYYRDHPADWWRLSSEGLGAAADAREERRQRSVYEDDLGAWLERTRRPVTWWEEIAKDFLLLPRPQWPDRRAQMEVAKALKALGWHKDKRERIDDALVYPWRPGDDWRTTP